MPFPLKSKKFMTSRKIRIRTCGAEETYHLGTTLGTLIENPLIIALIGELGSGKTAFVQGLAKGLEVPVDYYITSPSFTLINEYPGRLLLFHVDLYRLDSLSELEDIGLDEILCEHAVIAIEWADKCADDMFSDYLAIHFEIIDDNCRRISLIAYGHEGVNLINALKKNSKER